VLVKNGGQPVDQGLHLRPFAEAYLLADLEKEIGLTRMVWARLMLARARFDR
jgi:hypothetical protein